MEPKLNNILRRHQELAKKLSLNLSNDEFAKLSKEYSDLNDLVELIERYHNVQQQLADLSEMAKDPEMKELIADEEPRLTNLCQTLEQDIKIALLPKDIDDDKNAILEIRAGAGGEEAGLFAAVLLRMYQRHAQNIGWKFEILSQNENGIGSIKEASALISGKGVFAKLKFESGVHRVQRVPVTETSGRIHTSTATVAVLPEAEEVDIEIDEKDLAIDVFRASGAGGQHVNTTDSAVRITHVPSGIVVSQQDERSQHKNKAKALKILRAKLYELEKSKQDKERSANRKEQVGKGDRSERIRTYNYPQGRISDHRINLTVYKLEQILEGNGLDEIINALILDYQAQLLSEDQ